MDLLINLYYFHYYYYYYYHHYYYYYYHYYYCYIIIINKLLYSQACKLSCFAEMQLDNCSCVQYKFGIENDTICNLLNDTDGELHILYFYLVIQCQLTNYVSKRPLFCKL